QCRLLAPSRGDFADHSALTWRPRSDGDALVVERRGGDSPALALGAEAGGVGHPHVAEEYLVELGLARYLAQRPDFHTRVGHVAQEVGQSSVLRHVRIGARHQDRHPSVVGGRGPHLLPVDDPVVAVAHRAGGERREIRSCAGFAEQLAVYVLTGIQGPKELSLLFLGADRDDGRCGHTGADAVLLHSGGWRSGGGKRGVDLFLKALRHTETAVAFWK